MDGLERGDGYSAQGIATLAKEREDCKKASSLIVFATSARLGFAAFALKFFVVFLG